MRAEKMQLMTNSQKEAQKGGETREQRGEK